MWWETLYMCRVLSCTSQLCGNLTASILWSCPRDTHRPVRPQWTLPIAFTPGAGLAGMQVPPRTLCQWGPAVLLWPEQLLASCQRLPHGITATEMESARQKPGPQIKHKNLFIRLSFWIHQRFKWGECQEGVSMRHVASSASQAPSSTKQRPLWPPCLQACAPLCPSSTQSLRSWESHCPNPLTTKAEAPKPDNRAL